ncbi:hypothetical protein ACFWGD_07175 [Corynebacterium sp. NPDC060344]|uniref:hypothetical protein n=1 Tax=Corynebacterium sp. NPDC060344 TaxID=3347101 RepID=UPI00364EB4FE
MTPPAQPSQPRPPAQAGPPGAPGHSTRPALPDQIVGAWQAWLATCVLQVAAALTTLAINLLNPGALLEVSGFGGQSVGGAFPELGPDEKIFVARGSAIMTMLLTVVAAGLFAFLAFRMRAGAKWARLLLVAGSAYLIVRMLVMFTGGPVGPWASAPATLQLADGALAIASATAAGAAVVLASGRTAMEYFGAGGKDGGDGR